MNSQHSERWWVFNTFLYLEFYIVDHFQISVSDNVEILIWLDSYFSESQR